MPTTPAAPPTRAPYITWLSSPEHTLAQTEAGELLAAGGTDDQADALIAAAKGEYLDRAETAITALENANLALRGSYRALSVELAAHKNGQTS